MEIQQAITELQKILNKAHPCDKKSEALSMAISALEQQQEQDTLSKYGAELLTVDGLAKAYLEICNRNCNIAEMTACRFWNHPSVGLNGEPLLCGCELEMHYNQPKKESQ